MERTVRHRRPPGDRSPSPSGPASSVANSYPPRKDRPVLNTVGVVVGLIASAAAGYYFWSTAGRVSLEADGAPIVNAAELIDSGERLMDEIATADGAVLAPDAGCHFAPGRGDQPTIVCGPVWLGRSAVERPWFEMQLRYDQVGGEAVGELLGGGGPVEADPSTFTRPDAVSAVEPGEPTPPADRPRLRNGSLVLAQDDLVAAAEVQAAATLEESEATDFGPVAMADGWRCYLLEGPDRVWDSLVIDDNAYCGPARTAGSDADELWLPVSLRFEDGPSWGSVVLETVGDLDDRPRSIPEGASLVRPDGLTPPAVGVDDVARPPVATDLLAVVDYPLPVDADVSGALVTSNGRLDFVALARVKSAGAGARSFLAPAGHDLVVASIAPSEDRTSIRATLSIDGATTELPRLPAIPEGGAIVAAVPESATSVDLTVENNGRPQTMSLLDGTLQPGYPLALYRPDALPSAALGTRVEMPVGEAVLVTGTLAAVRWEAQDEDGNWLPEGLGHLLLEVADWKIDPPCCDVRVESVAATFSLINSVGSESAVDGGGDSDEGVEGGGEENAAVGVAGDVYRDRRPDQVAGPDRFRPPRFEVPEDLDGVTVQIEIVVSLMVDDRSETATEVVELEVDLANP